MKKCVSILGFLGMMVLFMPSAHAVVTAVNSPPQNQSVSTMTVRNSLKLPRGIEPPATDCQTNSDWGKVYIDTDATSGSVVYVCEGTNGWTAQGGGGGGGSSLEVFNNFDGTRKTGTTAISFSAAFLGGVSGSTYTARINTSSVTAQGNTFNAANKLLLLDGSAFVPTANLPASVSLLGSQIDISAETNLTASAPLSLTDDDLSVDTTSASGLLVNSSATATYLQQSVATASYQPLDATLTDLAAAPLSEDNSIAVGAIAGGTLPSDVMASSVTLPAFFSDATVRSNLGLAIGTNVQAYDADLDDLADGSLTGSKVGSGVPAANIASGSLGSSVIASSVSVTGFYSNNAVRSALGLAIGTDVEPWDADLDDLADGSLSGSKVGSGVPAANIASGSLGGSVIASSVSVSGFFNNSSVRSNLGLAIGTDVQGWDADLDDLADGSLTGSKIGSGVSAANIASGSLGASVLASSLTATGVTAGSYTSTNLTVDAQGRITTAANGSASGGVSVYPATSTIYGVFKETFFAPQAKLPGSSAPFISASTTEVTASLYFDEVSTQSVTWPMRCVDNYGGRAISADIVFFSSATSGTVNWGIYTATVTPNVTTTNMDSLTYNTVVSTSVTALASTNQLQRATVALANTTVTNGSCFVVKLERQAGLSDTMVGYARAVLLKLYE